MKKLSLMVLIACFALLPALADEIQVTSPAAGASWMIGTSKIVQWTFFGIPASAKVHVVLWQNGSNLGRIAEQIDIGANGQGSFNWNAGALLNGSVVAAGAGYSIKVRRIDNSVEGQSGTFSLSSGSGVQAGQLHTDYSMVKKSKPEIPAVSGATVTMLQVSEPKAGTVLLPTGSADILWKFVNIPSGNVSVSLLRNGQPDVVLAANHANPGQFHWDLNALNPDPGSYKIAVETLDKAHRGLSGAFTIKEQGEIVPVFPIQDNQFYQNTSLDVQWNRVGNIQLVNLTLKKSGSSWEQTLANGVSAKLGKQKIILGDLAVGEYRIEFKYANEGGFSSAYSGYFTILAH